MSNVYTVYGLRYTPPQVGYPLSSPTLAQGVSAGRDAAVQGNSRAVRHEGQATLGFQVQWRAHRLSGLAEGFAQAINLLASLPLDRHRGLVRALPLCLCVGPAPNPCNSILSLGYLAQNVRARKGDKEGGGVPGACTRTHAMGRTCLVQPRQDIALNPTQIEIPLARGSASTAVGSAQGSSSRRCELTAYDR